IGLFLWRTGHYSYAYGNNDIWHFTLNLLLLQYSGLQSGFSFNGPSWSICTEALVNLAFLYAVTIQATNQFRRLFAIFLVVSVFVLCQAHLPLIDPSFLWASLAFLVGSLLSIGLLEGTRAKNSPAISDSKFDTVSQQSFFGRLMAKLGQLWERTVSLS